VLISRFSPQEYKLLFCISVIYGLACTTQIAFPILFKEAKLFCSNQADLSSGIHSCYESEACSGNSSFFIDKKTSPHSLSTQFDLICDSKSEQRKSLSIIFGVSMFGVLFNLLTILKPVWRKSFYSFCGIVIGASQLFSVYFSNNLMLISFFLGVASLGYILILTYSFLLINDLFEDDTAKVSFGVLNILWGALGVIYSLLGMWTNADWKSLNIVTGIPIIIASVILNMLDEDQEADFIVPQSPELPQIEVYNKSHFARENIHFLERKQLESYERSLQ